LVKLSLGRQVRPLTKNKNMLRAGFCFIFGFIVDFFHQHQYG